MNDFHLCKLSTLCMTLVIVYYLLSARLLNWINDLIELNCIFGHVWKCRCGYQQSNKYWDLESASDVCTWNDVYNCSYTFRFCFVLLTYINCMHSNDLRTAPRRVDIDSTFWLTAHKHTIHMQSTHSDQDVVISMNRK